MSRRLRIRLYQPSNCAGAVSACQNKKQDEYEDEDEVDEVEEERDDHEGEYERVKTMATIMTTMAIVFGCMRRHTLWSVPIRMLDRDIHPSISLDGPICCISTNQSRG